MARPGVRSSKLLDGTEVTSKENSILMDNDEALMALFDFDDSLQEERVHSKSSAGYTMDGSGEGEIHRKQQETKEIKSVPESADESGPAGNRVQQLETSMSYGDLQNRSVSSASQPSGDKEEPLPPIADCQEKPRPPYKMEKMNPEQQAEEEQLARNKSVEDIGGFSESEQAPRFPSKRYDENSKEHAFLSEAMQRKEASKQSQGQVAADQDQQQAYGQPASYVKGQRAYAYKSLSKPEAAYKSYKKQVVAIHSPKGGVGKTTITKELAFGFGSAVVNNEPLKILVIDGDWEFGNIAIQFDIAPVPNVSEWVRVMRRDREMGGKIPMYSREEIDDRYLIHYSENIDILAGSPNSMDSQLIDSEIVAAIIDNLRKVGNYDFILIDNANSLKDTTVIPLMLADTVILVETLDTTTIQDTKNMLDTLRSLQFDYSKIRMVLNNVPEDDNKLDIAVAEIPRVLRLELAAVVPAYDQIRLYNNSGEAAILDKETSFSREIKKLANNIMPVFDTKPKGILARLLSRFKKGR